MYITVIIIVVINIVIHLFLRVTTCIHVKVPYPMSIVGGVLISLEPLGG